MFEIVLRSSAAKGAFLWENPKTCIKGTDESTLDKDSSVPLMHHDPNDLRSQISQKNATLVFVRAVLFRLPYSMADPHLQISWGGGGEGEGQGSRCGTGSFLTLAIVITLVRKLIRGFSSY